MDFNIGPIDIGDLPGYNLPDPTISLVNYDAETGIVEFSDGSTYNTKTDQYTAGELADANTQVSNQVYATRFGERAPQIVEYFDRWQNLLSGGMDIPQDVDKRDDAFNETIYFTDPTYQGFQDPSPITWAVQNLKSFEDIRTLADLPEYLSIYDDYQNSSDIITSETVSEAYWTLLSGDGPEAALSEYYGTDIKLGDTTGANYTNISKYGDMGEEEFRQFQSIIKPILEMSVPYVMLTQGLEYADAVEYTYTHDPMAAAVYTAYGVDLYRQTGDGSTYIFDPILGQEMRTLEVKDPNLRDIMPTIAQTVLITAATAGLGNLLSTMYANAGLSAGSATATGTAVLPPPSSALETIVSTSGTSGATSTAVQAGSAASIAGNATAAALITAAQGGDLEAALQAAVFAGGGEFLANSDIVKSTLDSLNGYLGGALDGIDINLTLGDARPSAGTLAGSAASALGSLMEVLTGSGGSGGGSGALCFAPPCEPGTVFVGNAFAGIPADELTEEVLTSWTLSGSGASSGTATITAEQFWNEFRNQWYNYTPKQGNTVDPNKDLPGFDILPNDSNALKLAKSLANSFQFAVATGSNLVYNKDTGEWEEAGYGFKNWLNENVQKFADNIDDGVKGDALKFLQEQVDQFNADNENERDSLMWSTIAINTGGSMLEWLNTSLAAKYKYDPNTPLGKLASDLQGLAEAAKPEDFKKRAAEMDANFAAADGLVETAKALYGDFASTPAEFFYHYLSGEAAEEAAQLGISAITAGAAGIGAYFTRKGSLAAAKIAAKIGGLSADLFTGFVESFGAEAAGTYEEAKKLALEKGMSEADAETYAQKLAYEVGMTSAYTELASSTLGLDAISNFIAGKRGEGSDAIRTAISTAIGGLEEGVQGGIVSWVKNVGLSEIDPTIDILEEVKKDFLLEAVVGTFISGSVSAVDTISNAVRSNLNVQDTVGRATQANPDDPEAAAVAIRDEFNNPNSFFYQAMQGFRGVFGDDFADAINTASSSDILNDVYDEGYTSTTETQDAFRRLGYDGFTPTYEDMLNILNGSYNDSTIQNAVLDYADPLYKDREEVLAAAEAAGITLTEDQINNLIGRGDDTGIGTDIQNLLPDPNRTSDLIAYTDFDNSIVYYKDGTTYNLRTQEFKSGTVNPDGTVTYGDGSTYDPTTGNVTNASGNVMNGSTTGTQGATGSWFDNANDSDVSTAQRLWELAQSAVDRGNLVEARGYLDDYASLTGSEDPPPGYTNLDGSPTGVDGTKGDTVGTVTKGDVKSGTTDPFLPDETGSKTGNWFDNANASDISTAQRLWELAQSAVDMGNLNEAQGYLDSYSELTGLDTPPPGYDPIDGTRFNTVEPDGGADPTGGWFDTAGDADLGVANTLWSLYQRAVNNGDDATATGFLDLYRNLTGVDTQPPDYTPPESLGPDGGQDPDGGVTPDGGVDFTDVLGLLNDLVANGATQEAVDTLKTELIGLLADVASQESVDAVQDTVDEILTSLSGVAQEATLVEFRDTLYTMIDGLATQSSVDSLATKIDEYEAAGLKRDEALAKAISDLSADLGVSLEELAAAVAANTEAITNIGVTVGDIDTAVTNIQETLATLASQESVDALNELIVANEEAGLARDEALAKALEDLATQLGTDVETLATAIGENAAALEALGVTTDELTTAVGDIQETLGTLATQETVDALSELVAANEEAGLARDEALAKALEDLATQLGTDVETLAAAIGENAAALEAIGVTTDELTTAVGDIQETLGTLATQESVDNLNELVAEYEAAGLSRDEALAQGLSDLAEQLGTDVETLATAIAGNAEALQAIGVTTDELTTAVGDIQETLGTLATQESVDTLNEMITANEEAGLARDEALQKAISDFAGQTGQSFEEVASAIATNQDLLTELGVSVGEVSEVVNNIQEELKNVASQESVDQLNSLIQQYEAAGIARDEATQLAISDLATQLGVTEQTIIDNIAATEQRLSTELDAVSQLIGKPPSQVTDVDIDFVADIIAQQEALGEMLQYTSQQLGYDVNGDGVIDINDLTLLQQSQQGEQVDLSQAQQFQPTGLYDFVLGLNQQTQSQLAAEAAKTRQDIFAGNLLNLLEASDFTGQQVTVETPDPARIGYLYDFSSIFATPQQEGMFVSPYGGQRGYKKGGSVLDINDELLRLLGE